MKKRENGGNRSVFHIFSRVLIFKQNEAEKNADVLGRTKELIHGNDGSRYSEYE
jgi:hypothetical protein